VRARRFRPGRPVGSRLGRAFRGVRSLLDPNVSRPRGVGATSTRQIRVLWVNQYVGTPDQAGGTRHLEMSAALRERGFDVRIVTSDLTLGSRSYSRRDGPADLRTLHEDIEGVPFVWLPAGSYQQNDWRRALSMLVFARHALTHLLRTVRRGDVVIGSTPQLFAAAAARLAAFARGGRFILEVRDLWPESLVAVSGRSGPVALALRIIADALYRSSRAILILAEGNRRPIERHGGRPARVMYVPNGVDLASFERSQTCEVPDLDWIDASPTFVYAGAHGPANGLGIVLAAAEDLQRRGRSDVRVLLLGAGPSKGELQREATRLQLHNLVFHDPVPKAAIPGILRRCTGGLMVLKDVELFRHGVSPNKLFDYLAADLPVITNVGGDVGGTVERSGAGLRVPPGDHQALADAMVAVADGQTFDRLGSAYVRDHHDRIVLAERLAGVIRAVAGRPFEPGTEPQSIQRAAGEPTARPEARAGSWRGASGLYTEART
jgi:glycosyltransferase involved in cell wall biosynthesis